MRVAALLSLVCACSVESTKAPVIEVSFPEADAAGGVIPFRSGGPFQVKVTGQESELGMSSHATIEIVASTIPTDATATATVTLSNQSEGVLAGTATLKWPSGGPSPDDPVLRVRALVGNASPVTDVPLERPALAVVPGSLSNTGSQLVQSLCFDSTSTDGALSLHLIGAKLDTGVADGTVPLVPGSCTGAFDPKSPSSYASIKVIVTDAAVQVIATLPSTTASVSYQSPAPPQGTLTLVLGTPSAMPPRESIVDVTATARVNGTPAKDIVVTFQSIPNTTLVPISANTNSQGEATATFQMPKEGSVRVTAVSGNKQSNSVTFWP